MFSSTISSVSKKYLVPIWSFRFNVLVSEILAVALTLFATFLLSPSFVFAAPFVKDSYVAIDPTATSSFAGSLSVSGQVGLNFTNGLLAVLNGFLSPVLVQSPISFTNNTLSIPDASVSSSGLVTTGAQTFAGTKTLSDNLTINGVTKFKDQMYTGENIAGANFAVWSPTNSANVPFPELTVGGAPQTDLKVSIRGSDVVSVASDRSYGSLIIGTMLVNEATSGTHPLFSQLAIKPLTLGNLGADTAAAATLYIEGAAVGGVTANNYALWVDNGASRFDGDVTISSDGSGTTTVSVGEMGNTNSHACFNTKNTDGNDISFYFVGTQMIVENNICN